MENDGIPHSKENLAELHNTILTFLLVLLEKYDDNKIEIHFEPEELENLAERIMNNEFTLNSLFEPVEDEEGEVVGVNLILQRFNKTDLLVQGLFNTEGTNYIM